MKDDANEMPSRGEVLAEKARQAGSAMTDEDRELGERIIERSQDPRLTTVNVPWPEPTTDDYIKQGGTSAMNGLKRQDNPHEADSSKWFYWDKGWWYENKRLERAKQPLTPEVIQALTPDTEHQRQARQIARDRLRQMQSDDAEWINGDACDEDESPSVLFWSIVGAFIAVLITALILSL